MADAEDLKYAEVRGRILDAVRKNLIGPMEPEESIRERPTITYITGMLYPTDSAEVDMAEDYTEPGFPEAEEQQGDGELEAPIIEEDESEPVQKGRFKKPSSLGISFYVEESVKSLRADVSWGMYHQEKRSVEKTTSSGDVQQKEETVYVRGPVMESVALNSGQSGKIRLQQNSQVSLYLMQRRLSNGYRMISLYLHNDTGNGGEEYERVMFQAELAVSASDGSPVFVPEFLCRQKEIEGEYYYKSRPVFARGRGCAAVWEKNDGDRYARTVKSAFIPDHEICAVSPELHGIPEKAFSMRSMAKPDRKEETLKILRLLASLYAEWIEGLRKRSASDASMTGSVSAKIIGECRNALARISAGIDLLQNDEKAFQAFLFMNQSMYLQRSITAFSQKYRQAHCSLRDFVKKDHSEWRPFQIAFILLNLYGIIHPESEDRENVDLLYFPTGGGKTEAYLGLIAFTVAYRRLTASDEREYEKDGGVTVIMRYTLRLLTTQQRDRLLKLVVAMDMIRKKNPEQYGESEISIGFWVGGGVTPNKFKDYVDGNEYKKKEFIWKLTKQVIRCPYCGKDIKPENYRIIPEEKSVKIHCSDPNCYFHEGAETPRHIPAYLVDEEIYGKCPTVIISTVDKFAQLPWRNNIGLLFGRSDRYCPRCGYIARGEEHEKRHNAARGRARVDVEPCRPFYPPELIIQDELHLITGPLGTIYGGYETVVQEMCSVERNGRKILPKYIASTATIRNAEEQIRCLYSRKHFSQFPPDGLDAGDSCFMREIPLSEKPFRQYAGICASGQSMKTTIVRLFSIILHTAYDLSRDPEYEDYIDPYYTLIGYFNSIRELGGARRMLDDDIVSRLKLLGKRYGENGQRYLNNFSGVKEITSRIPSWQITGVLEELAMPYNKALPPGSQKCYDVVIATNMISVGMDVDRLGTMAVVGQPKQNSEYIQATSRVGRKFPGIIFTVYNPYRPRDLSNYENFVGIHSQLYRYVEGTTATPFAARARDRFLHALVVALCRLQMESLTENKGASKILETPETELQRIIKPILERVAMVAPGATGDTEKEIQDFIEMWKSIAGSGKLHYYLVTQRDDESRRLLAYYGYPCMMNEKPTLNSMRDVEQSSSVYYWEANV